MVHMWHSVTAAGCVWMCIATTTVSAQSFPETFGANLTTGSMFSSAFNDAAILFIVSNGDLSTQAATGFPNFNATTDADVNDQCASECAAHPQCVAVVLYQPGNTSSSTAVARKCLGLSEEGDAPLSCPTSWSECHSYSYNGRRETPTLVNTARSSGNSDPIPVYVGWIVAGVVLMLLVATLAVLNRQQNSGRKTPVADDSQPDSDASDKSVADILAEIGGLPEGIDFPVLGPSDYSPELRRRTEMRDRTTKTRPTAVYDEITLAPAAPPYSTDESGVDSRDPRGLAQHDREFQRYWDGSADGVAYTDPMAIGSDAVDTDRSVAAAAVSEKGSAKGAEADGPWMTAAERGRSGAFDESTDYGYYTNTTRVLIDPDIADGDGDEYVVRTRNPSNKRTGTWPGINSWTIANLTADAESPIIRGNEDEEGSAALPEAPTAADVDNFSTVPSTSSGAHGRWVDGPVGPDQNTRGPLPPAYSEQNTDFHGTSVRAPSTLGAHQHGSQPPMRLRPHVGVDVAGIASLVSEERGIRSTAPSIPPHPPFLPFLATRISLPASSEEDHIIDPDVSAEGESADIDLYNSGDGGICVPRHVRPQSMGKWTTPDENEPLQNTRATTPPRRKMSEYGEDCDILARNSIDKGVPSREGSISEIIGHEAGEGRAPRVGVDVNAISALTTVTEDDSSVSCSDTMSSARMSTTAITPTRPSRSPRIPLDATLGATAMPDEVFLDLDPPQGVWTTQPSDHEENMDSVA
eukprot:m.168900 g.168900  ORF g.168900 m.168900 type:complete len:750 (+) comp24138_c0_seq2:239-2488(+)